MLLLPETVTIAQARDVLRMLAQSQPRDGRDGSALTIDASALRRFDSSALAVLLETARLARAWGRRFVVHQPPPDLVRLADLYGVKDLLFDAA